MADTKTTPQKKYLVIKHGALGDFILATGPMAAIRRRHPKSHIVLLTTQRVSGDYLISRFSEPIPLITTWEDGVPVLPCEGCAPW